MSLRIERRRSLDSSVSSTPLNRIDPADGSSSRRTHRPAVVLPEPDSPTRPSVSPTPTLNETPDTACTTRWSTRNPREWRTWNTLTRSVTSSTGSGIDRHRPVQLLGPDAGRLSRLERTQLRQRLRCTRLWAWGHRGAKAQPGGRPQHVRRRAGDRDQPRRARAPAGTPSRPRVYGCEHSRNSDSTSPRSTARPAYMTCTRSTTRATTPRSWVISTIAVLSSCWMRCITSRIWACTVTSSAVVGSSAMSTSGSLAIAMAIITRWRMPPENSCGYCSARWAGCGMPTMPSRSTALRCAAAFVRVLVRADHLDDLHADLLHRVQRRQRVLEDHRDPLAAHRSHQLVRRADELDAGHGARAGDLRRRRQQAEQAEERDRLARSPDSPTTPTISRAPTSRSTPRTACTSPLRVLNVTRKSRSERTESAPTVNRHRRGAWGRWRHAGRRR